MIFHYDTTPLPVGLPISTSGSKESYALGMYDGDDHGEQYMDEPNYGVLFESPDAAKRWLKAVEKALKPYIENGDIEARTPDSGGWDL